MASIKNIEEFVGQKKFAVVGVSSSGKKFGNTVFKEFKQVGLNAVPVNKNASEINGEKCYSSLSELHDKIDAAVLVIPPHEAQKVVKEAKAAGIKNIWFQRGSESPEALTFCSTNNINFISGECVLMFINSPGFPHKFHGWINKLLGKYPS